MFYVMNRFHRIHSSMSSEMSYYIFVGNRRLDDPDDPENVGIFVINDGSVSVNNYLNAKADYEAVMDAYRTAFINSTPLSQVKLLLDACIITQNRLKHAVRVLMNETRDEPE